MMNTMRFAVAVLFFAAAQSFFSSGAMSEPVPGFVLPGAPDGGVDISRREGSYEAFARYALDHAAPPPPGRPRRSALIDLESLMGTPVTAPCRIQPPAVSIDLDPGDTRFNPDDPPLPEPGLSRTLEQIRMAGLGILWVSSLPESEAGRVRTILQASGLDPDGTDSLILLRGPQERKQTRLLSASRDWCVIAMAADRRGDFEEAWDYVRDPLGPVARAFEDHLGAGWFLAPPPIR